MLIIETALFAVLITARVIQIGLLMIVPVVYILGLPIDTLLTLFFTIVFTGAVSEGLLPYVTRRVHKRNPALHILRTVKWG